MFKHQIAFETILRKEITRFTRIWVQTLLPPVITMSLYFLIFGNLIGSRVGQIGGVRYVEYIAPGLIMMSVITNAYANVVSSFFGAKFQRSIEELIVAPVPNTVVLAGYISGGIARGLAVGLLVTAVALFFADLRIHSWLVTSLILVLTAALFSLGGFINGVYARSFDDTSIIPTFILTPLTYLGGVFYSVDMLPEVPRALSYLNPILYMVNAFRYGLLGTSDISPLVCLAVTMALVIALSVYALWLLERGTGIRT
jgi:ABC-2 type transport system permease protein